MISCPCNIDGTGSNDAGRKRRLVFGSRGKSSITVHRSEEVYPEEVRLQRQQQQQFGTGAAPGALVPSRIAPSSSAASSSQLQLSSNHSQCSDQDDEERFHRQLCLTKSFRAS